MVDFKKQLAGKKGSKPIDPVALYDTLDRAHDKGPLRPAQLHVLATWFSEHRSRRDAIVKLHTGQGKTLIGLLMLQSMLNDSKGPAVYLCPDNYLISQTCEQAKQFGIQTCVAEGELPAEFFSGERILVTSVQKMFNGLTKFALHNKSSKVGVILMDDAHACSDRIREANRIRIPNDDPAYHALRVLFESDLSQQGVGTYADICNDRRDSFLPVPYWTWIQQESNVATILAAAAERKSVRFAWPLLKNMLADCQCVISGEAVEIEPYVPPLNAFGSYWNAAHRVFMSATVTDDAFLVKGLRLTAETISSPLAYDKERWSGEKMVLLPALIDAKLQREQIVNTYGMPNSARTYGVVSLVPSFAHMADWKKYGATVAEKSEQVGPVVSALKKGRFEATVVLANRYDGIDLPDDTCRILVFDGIPYSESLIDLYEEACRPRSEATVMRRIRTVEQGMGRSVRGEKDYSVVIIVGDDFARLLRDQDTMKHVSPQTATQIEIGLKIAEMTKSDIAAGTDPKIAMLDLIRQCLSRDDGWKEFYVEQMAEVRPRGANPAVLKMYEAELAAESSSIDGDYVGAQSKLQKLLDSEPMSREDKAWHLQTMARYQYRRDRTESQRLQANAHSQNRLLLKPQTGVVVKKLTLISQGRVERIVEWVRKYPDYAAMQLVISDVLGALAFGVKADKFEQALQELSEALGFKGERPDKEWKEGPDNLWALDEDNYLLWECKNEVDLSRSQINKREAEQMNRSSAWFGKHYGNVNVRRLMVHPAAVVESAGALLHDVEAVRQSELRKLVKTVRDFFQAFASMDFSDTSPAHIQSLLEAHKLTVDDFLEDYAKKIKDIA